MRLDRKVTTPQSRQKPPIEPVRDAFDVFVGVADVKRARAR
jgi:hypothetical protein